MANLEPEWRLLGWDAGDWVPIVAGVLAALIAALVAVIGYVCQQRAARAERRRTMYAEALRAVEDYLEAPYLIRRRDGSATARRELTAQVSDVQSRLNFYRAWMQLHAPAKVHVAYSAYVSTARREAGTAMTQAWQAFPTRRDRDVPLGAAISYDETTKARGDVLAAIRPTSRWRPRGRGEGAAT